MKISVLTIVPEYFSSFLCSTQVVRAVKKKAAEIEIVDIKEFAEGSYRKIDDAPYGGGTGCILRCEPVIGALQSIKESSSVKPHTILFSPAGKPYKQADARRLSRFEHIILICGHYEGVDERILKYTDEQISLGDYILSGGEIPAMAVMDSVVRLFPETLKEEAVREESFENGLLEYPQYTHPREFNGDCVPEILLSGNHEAIAKWRKEASLEKTRKYRPDLLKEDNKSDIC